MNNEYVEVVEEGDICIGWYPYPEGHWFVAHASEDSLKPFCHDHKTYRDAIREAIEIEKETGASCWREQDGGGLITDGSLDLAEELHSGWEGEDY